jgi:hypothetical protein
LSLALKAVLQGNKRLRGQEIYAEITGIKCNKAYTAKEIRDILEEDIPPHQETNSGKK